MIRFLDRIPFPLLIAASVLIGLAPFTPEPHALGKIRMLLNGSLLKPLDIFDLFYHSLPFLLLLAKSGRFIQQKRQNHR